MPHKKPKPRATTPPPSPLEQAFTDLRRPAQTFPTVSARWLLAAAAVSILGAALCYWAVLCFLFWQGSWQLLYHPASTITRTPAVANLAFDPVSFAPNDSGVPQLAGWWIPASPASPYARFTVLYLHGQDGNLSTAVDDLASLRAIGLNVFAFDYRGYGQSQFAHPSEAHWLADANFALNYLTQTRHIPPASILIAGKDLGANLALEFAATHPDLAGAILDQPLDAPMTAVFNDPRAALVPAYLLVRDRYDANAAAASLRVPVLWFVTLPTTLAKRSNSIPSAPHEAYTQIAARKTIVALNAHDPTLAAQRSAALIRWLDDLSVPPPRP